MLLAFMIGAPLMTFALARVRRNAALIALMAIFTGGAGGEL
jgi:predicted MFS family arabinose efflux permease